MSNSAFLPRLPVYTGVYSLNVPVPAQVGALATDIARSLPEARPRSRGTHTLGVKRLTTSTHDSYNHTEARVRELLVGQPSFEVRVHQIDYFAEASTGPSPVVYLGVESPELRRLHRELAEAFPPISGIGGDAYTPHITVARGGTLADAKRVAERDIDPITWTVTELLFWDATHRQPVSRLSLPA